MGNSKYAYDLSEFRQMLSGLQAEDIIDQDEKEAITKYLANADDINEEILMEASELAEESEQVYDMLETVLRTNIGPQEPIDPEQVVTEPLISAKQEAELQDSEFPVETIDEALGAILNDGSRIPPSLENIVPPAIPGTAIPDII